MNSRFPAFAEFVRGRYFAAFLASLPDGACVLFPDDLPDRLEDCAPDTLVAGLRLGEGDEPQWEDAVAEWMLSCDGPLVLTPSRVLRAALRHCPRPETGGRAEATWQCGYWPPAPSASARASAGLTLQALGSRALPMSKT
jgi:hypothetical protein